MLTRERVYSINDFPADDLIRASLNGLRDNKFDWRGNPTTDDEKVAAWKGRWRTLMDHLVMNADSLGEPFIFVIKLDGYIVGMQVGSVLDGIYEGRMSLFRPDPKGTQSSYIASPDFWSGAVEFFAQYGIHTCRSQFPAAAKVVGSLKKRWKRDPDETNNVAGQVTFYYIKDGVLQI